MAIQFYSNLGVKEKFNFADKGMVAFSADEEAPAIILKDISKFSEQKPTIWFVVENVLIEYEKMINKGIIFNTASYSIGTEIAVEFNDSFGNVLGITDYIKDNNEYLDMLILGLIVKKI